MSSRFYFNYKYPDRAVTGLPDHNWVGTVPLSLMDTAKGGTPQQEIFMQSINPSPTHLLHYRGISRRLSPQIIDNDAYGAIFYAKIEAPDFLTTKFYSRIIAYIVSFASPTAPAVLETYLIFDEFYQSPSPILEWKSPDFWTQTIDGNANGFMISPPNTPPFTFKDYRLVVEFGCTAVRAGTSVAGTRGRYGARASNWNFLPDVDPNVLITSNPNPSPTAGWLETNSTFTLMPFTYGFNNHEPESLDPTPSPASISLNPSFPTDRWWGILPSPSKIVNIRICNPTNNNAFNTLGTYEIPGPNPPYTFHTNGPVITEKLISSIITAIRVTQSPGGVTTLILEDVLRGTVAPGDLLLPDDIYGRNPYDVGVPAGITQFYAPDGTLRHYDAKIGSVKIGVSLGDGRWAGVVPRDFPTLDLFVSYSAAPAFGTLGVLAYSQEIYAMGSDFKSYYLISGTSPINNATFQRINPDASGGPTWPFPVGRIGAGSDLGRMTTFGVSRDSKLVFYGGGLDKLIHVYDIINSVALPSFTVKPSPQYTAGDIIVLSDDTVVVAWINISTNDATIYHYTPTGTLLHQYSTTNLHHIVHEFNDPPDQIWIETHVAGTLPVGMMRFDLLRITDNVILKSFLVPVDIPVNDGCSPVQYPIGFTAGLIMMMALAVNISGIYFISPNKTTYADDYIDYTKKIPDPTVKTALLGE